VLFAEALAATLLFTPMAKRMGERWNLIDIPDPERKVHTEITARSGGLAMTAAFFFVLGINLIVAFALRDRVPFVGPEVARFVANVPEVGWEISALLLGTCVAVGVGLLDDRRPLPPGVKLLGQIVAAGILVSAGIHVRLFGLPDWVGMAVTVVWVVGLTNAFNFLDNMDGLSAGVASICAVVLLWALFCAGERFTPALLSVFLGCALGFLWHNWFPARLFMGDGGSHFLGFFLAAVSVLGTYYQPEGDTARLAVLLPVIIFGLPLFDMVSVILIRLGQGRSPFQADTQHFSHRLVALGMRPPRAVLTIYLLSFAIGLSGLALLHLPPAQAWVHLIAVALIFVVIWLLEHVGRQTNGGGESPHGQAQED
jgi:UDP-GlcNAc:undecaprenyl-phosphate/decaprenyl-phosphate GlcNAc-1-phosphate transferase